MPERPGPPPAASAEEPDARSTTVLSLSQRALWASQRRHPDSPLQNMALLTHIDGSVDPDRLAEAFEAVVLACSTLRLTIDHNDTAAIAPSAPMPTTMVRLGRQEARAWAEQRVTAPVDVSRSVYDSVIFRHDDGTVSWYLCLHHVATDATSSALVFEATARAYHGEPFDIAAVDSAPLPTSKRAEQAAQFWKQRPPAPLIDSLYQPIEARSTETVRHRLDNFDPAQVEAAIAGPYRMISADLAWTAVLMTALSVHVYRVSGAERFAIGVPVHNRSGRNRHHVVGPLMEVYPVDIEIEPASTFADLFAGVSKQLLTVVGNALPEVGASAADVSAIVNVIPRGSFGTFGDAPTSTAWIHSGAADPSHLLGVQLTRYDSAELALDVDINAAGADAHHQRGAVQHLHSIITAMVDKPTAPILAVPIATDREVELVRAWGDGGSIAADRFAFDEQQAQSTGTVVDRLSAALSESAHIAVSDGDEALTGHQLWARSGTVAANLAAAGIGPGHRVGIESKRSIDAVVSIVGVLRAGASYVPIDPALPESRRRSICERAGVSEVLAGLRELDSALSPAPASIDADHEAYVLFTSGSTGEPKAVPITHGGLADYLAFACDHYLGAQQGPPVAPLFTSLGFDLTVTSLFVPLISGGTVVIIAEDGVPGLQAVASCEDLTWIKATPSHLELLARLLPCTHQIATMVVGGEAFPARLAHALAGDRDSLEIFNEYGPTEAVVGCMIHRFDPDSPTVGDVPIGRPAPGVVLRIVDAHGHDVPPGVAGELMISSSGLSPGYLGEPVDEHPFSSSEGRRWYASGDVVRLSTPTEAAYLGRVDDQIKLNGVRLEPAEIVAALEQHPAVGRAVVRLWQPSPEARPVLAGWVEATAPLEPGDVRTFLLSRLASHQIPSAIGILDSLRFNSNGKLDIEELPPPKRVRGNDSGQAALDPRVSEHVGRSWRRALALGADHTFTAGDDFFVLGGDSLAALEMTAAVSDALGVLVSEGLIFGASTYGDFGAAVEAIDPGQNADIGPTPLGSMAMSPGEEAMLFEHHLDPASPRYNIGRRYVIDGPVDAERLRNAAERVITRHSTLRTTFGAQRRRLDANDALHFSTPTVDDRPLTDELSRVAADALYRAPFDLSNGPLVRIALHQLESADGAPRSAVVVVLHHISGDAGSLDRMWSDLDDAYSGRDLQPLAISYADHAVWQRDRDSGSDFWADLWSAPVETGLGLPGAAGRHRGGYVERPASFSATALRNGPGRTPTATALAAVATLLDRHHRPSADERPGRYAIGLTASVREHATSEPMVGYFLNTLPLVVEVDAAGASVDEVAASASDVLAAALPHRTHPFADMVARARRESRQLPAPDVLLAVEDLAPASLDGQAVDHEILASGDAVAAITVFVQIRGERIDLGIEFNGSVVDQHRAELILDDLDSLLGRALAAGETSRPTIEPLPSELDGQIVGPAAPDNASLLPEVLANVATRGTSLAAMCGDTELGWDELGLRSGRLAEQLRLNGVGPGDRVAVSLRRSVDLVVAIVGVLRCGAVYVPLDPSYPDARRATILRTAAPRVAVVEQGDEVSWLPSVVVPGDDHSAATFIDHEVSPDDPAYVIFTSGSTGVPKGVEVSHGRLATSTRARDGVYDGRPERFLLLSSIGFDSSIVGLVWTLFGGGAVVIPTETEIHDPDALIALLDRRDVSHVLMVPTLYRALLGRGSGETSWPSVVMVAGEACPSGLVAEHHALRPDSELWNEYGPTEGTVWTTAHRCAPSDDPVPIGVPIPGSWCAVVDDEGNPVPSGAVGELWIGGAGVVDGYVDTAASAPPVADEATAIPFVTHEHWGPAYRTGDAAAVEIGPDGAKRLLFRGRVDDQLNVGGVRLEPAEVERILASVDRIDAAAVVATTVGSSDRLVLVAHIACSGPADLAALRQAAAAALPAAARPTRYVTHDALPTTSHGKVDRAALAGMELADEAERLPDRSVGPLTSTERIVLELFRKHIQADVGVEDGFFDAGGDSLAALTLAMDLEDRFGVAFSVTSLLADSTARAVATHVAGNSTTQIADATGQADASHGASAADTSLVEWIRTGDADRAVLVLLAPGSGHLLGYEPLIRSIDPTRPILGVRLPGYDGKDEPIRSVEALASAVEELIDQALAERPGVKAVLLGGSSGGLLAWELQARAEAANRPFAAIVLQDTVHPDWRRAQASIGLVEQLRTIFERAGPAAVVGELYGRAERKYSRWQRARRSNAQAAETGVENPAVIAQRMFAATTAGLLAYKAPPVMSDVLFLAAANSDPDATFGRWQPLAGQLEVQVFDGDHFGENGITSASNVAPVAAALDAAMADIDQA